MILDETLQRDCHQLGTLDRAAVLLNRNASVGWLILVPETKAVDWHELIDAEHTRISAQIRALSAFTARWFVADKLNVATIGNVVRQMHVHVIARRFDDACWPQPVWGHLQAGAAYTDAEVATLISGLARELSLIPDDSIFP